MITPKGFLFDVDGVLYNSMPAHTRSWQVPFKELGLKLPAIGPYELEGVPEVKGVGQLAALTGKRLSKKEQMYIVERKRELYNKYKKPPFIAGARALVSYLKKRGYSICFVTGSFQTSTIQRLQKDFGMPRNLIITGADVKNGKPHPEPYLTALKKLGLKKSQAIVIENAPLGITSAVRAGVACIGLKTGLLSAATLKEHGAFLILKNCTELLAYFKNLGV